MKVYIGPYNHPFAPYRWAKKALRWWYVDKERVSLDDYDKVNTIARKKFKWLRTIEEWCDSRYTRKVKVRVDYYDTWGMDATLSLIILPMLKQLKETKHGSPSVDDSDVPDELKSASAIPPMTEEQLKMGEIDGNFHRRWEWVMNEMIWAFEQINDEKADDKFHSDADPAKPRDQPGISFEEGMKRGTFDKEGYMAWQDRKTRGLTLFGRYFEGLWD